MLLRNKHRSGDTSRQRVFPLEFCFTATTRETSVLLTEGHSFLQSRPRSFQRSIQRSICVRPGLEEVAKLLPQLLSMSRDTHSSPHSLRQGIFFVNLPSPPSASMASVLRMKIHALPQSRADHVRPIFTQ